ncbi:hypothetical protein [Pseudomonas sp. 34 E 7]|nr:hypothetical protein [Pseudomonas sp. 34 E 7]
MFHALLMQLADGIGGVIQRLGKLFSIGLDHPGARLQPGAQGFAAGVQGHFQTEVFQLLDQCLKPLRADATRQAAGDHHRVEVRADQRKSLEQFGLRLLAHQRPRCVDVGDPAILFGNLDIAAGFPRHANERVAKPTVGDQCFERLRVVLTEKAAHGHRVAEVRQHLRHVHALAGGMGDERFAAIDCTGFQARQAYREVQRRVQRQGQNPCHLHGLH